MEYMFEGLWALGAGFLMPASCAVECPASQLIVCGALCEEGNRCFGGPEKVSELLWPWSLEVLFQKKSGLQHH